MSEGRGICIFDKGVGLITIRAELRVGTGEIFVSGPVTGEFENVFQRSFNAACGILEFEELRTPDFSRFDINITVRNVFGAPLGGESYGLLLAMVLARTFTRGAIPAEIGVTGILDTEANVLPVDDIERKRVACKSLGITKLFLPGRQLDFFSREVAQVPVDTVYEAWSVLNYGQDSQT